MEGWQRHRSQGWHSKGNQLYGIRRGVRDHAYISVTNRIFLLSFFAMIALRLHLFVHMMPACCHSSNSCLAQLPTSSPCLFSSFFLHIPLADQTAPLCSARSSKGDSKRSELASDSKWMNGDVVFRAIYPALD